MLDVIETRDELILRDIPLKAIGIGLFLAAGALFDILGWLVFDQMALFPRSEETVLSGFAYLFFTVIAFGIYIMLSASVITTTVNRRANFLVIEKSTLLSRKIYSFTFAELRSGFSVSTRVRRSGVYYTPQLAISGRAVIELISGESCERDKIFRFVAAANECFRASAEQFFLFV